MRIHTCGDVFRNRASRSAVSAVMPRFPRMISFSRLREMPRRLAASSCPRPSGFRYSSSRISPGGIAGPNQLGSLVIVFDADFVRMSVLPPKRDPVLFVHPNTMPSRLFALLLRSCLLVGVHSFVRFALSVVGPCTCLGAVLDGPATPFPVVLRVGAC